MKDKDTHSADSEGVVHMDLRAELAQAPEPWEPLSKVCWTASQLGSGQVLRLLAPFEPVLLMRVLAAQGFSHQAARNSAGNWEVVFRRGTELGDDAEHAGGGTGNAPSSIRLDLRGVGGLPPLSKLIAALSQLPETAELVVDTDQPPVEGDLPEHCSCVTVRSGPTSGGGFQTRIRRRDE